ncbi:unnamed protein product [Caenorhabditis nigoni]
MDDSAHRTYYVPFSESHSIIHSWTYLSLLDYVFQVYTYTPDVNMQQESPFYPMTNSSNSSGSSGSPKASPSCPLPGSSHQVPEQPQQLEQIQQQHQMQGFEAAIIAQQYALYGYMLAMQAMTPLQSAAPNAVGKHHQKSPGFPYSKSQIAALNERFDRSDSIKIEERREMSKRIGLSERQIKVWFQNRRFKLNKIKKAQSEAQIGEQKHQDDTMDSAAENVK